MSVLYGRADNTTWPIDVDGDTQWVLRNGVPDRNDCLSAASILAAYAHLLDPTITQATAITGLKRARRIRMAHPSPAAPNVQTGAET